jgi:hypothetical protein
MSGGFGGVLNNPQFETANSLTRSVMDPARPGQPQQPGQQPGEAQVYPPFGGGLNKPFVNAPYQPATNMMSEADFNGFLQRQNEMQTANPTATFVNPMTTYQDYVNEVNQGQQTVANNMVSAQERARRGMIGFEGPNFTGQPMNPQGSRGTPSYSPTSQEAYNQFLATAKPVRGGSLPSYEQFVQNINTPRPIIGPQRPMPGRPMPQPQMPQPQMPQFDPRRSGLGALSGLNGVPGNQNPLYFGPGYK